jgi:hypothetical protein
MLYHVDACGGVRTISDAVHPERLVGAAPLLS